MSDTKWTDAHILSLAPPTQITSEVVYAEHARRLEKLCRVQQEALKWIAEYSMRPQVALFGNNAYKSACEILGHTATEALRAFAELDKEMEE